MSSLLLKTVAGALGGISATGPMTIVMELCHKKLPRSERYALPPREITRKVADEAGVNPGLQRPEGASLVLLNHFAYGGLAGILFALCRPERWPGALPGLAFGVFVWFVSYFGLLPAASVLRSAESHPPRRNLLMFGAHLLWGWLLGLFVREILSDRTEQRGALVSDSQISDRDCRR